MKSRRRFLATSLAAGVLAVHRSAFAHGNAEHAAKAASAPPASSWTGGLRATEIGLAHDRHRDDR
nr:hypothetical protein [Thauera chlorobenzoica]